MADRRRPEEWDALIDSALRSYVDAEPRSDLRHGVLQRVNATPETGGAAWSIRWPALAVACAAAAALAVGLVWQSAPLREREEPVRLAQVAVPPRLAQHTEPVFTTVHRHTTKRISRRQVNAQQNVFPSPSRLSPEEAAVLAIAQNQQLTKALAVSQKQQGEDIHPLEISAIQVQPLPADSAQKEN